MKSSCGRLFLHSGGVAQLGERRVRNAKVGSSILLLSTNRFKAWPSAGPFSFLNPERADGHDLPAAQANLLARSSAPDL
jgi:hypothetical protein